MRYRMGLTITAGQLQSTPDTVFLEVTPGVLTQIAINFPPGHAGLTYLQIYYQERQIYPTTPGVAFRGDDILLTFNDEWPIAEVPYKLELRGWAPLAEYDHTIFVDVTLLEIPQDGEPTSSYIGLPEGFL